MSGRNIRRAVSAISAVVVAAGFAVTVGTGAAGAADNSVSWSDGYSKFTRTISNVNLHPGDFFNVSIKFERKSPGPVEYIYHVKDVHPACWKFQTAQVNGIGNGRTSTGNVSPGMDYAELNYGSSGDWPVYPNIKPNQRTFTFNYVVGDNCDYDVPLTTGMIYSGSLGSGTYKTKGPAAPVERIPTTTTLTVRSDVQVGQSVPLTAHVNNNFAGPSGDVIEFYDGTTKIGTVPVNSGNATLDWTPTTKGDYSLSAKFVENTRLAASQSTVAVHVSDAETSTVLTGLPTAQTGTEVSFEAQVSPAPEGGIVQFRDGDTDLGIPVPVDADGKAGITHTFDSEGTHDITAVYSGLTGVAGSTSAGLSVTVSSIETTTVLTLPASAAKGAAVDLTAAVFPNQTGGTVKFFDGTVPIGDPVPVTDGMATLSHAFTESGDHQITAIFHGAQGQLGSTAQAGTVTVADWPGSIFGS
ncbi:Ig-like domain-containing protein [Rhodococcus marinonascens]|uniref:Ig-like domain-containing protein n=1 Tax=Rhodococcus marinonascens TaxID=38311 RepID=UPI000933B144|nr:Ig-like domain-containing protein [Rhodococcus marinonascens]